MSRTAGSPAAISLALGVAERVHVQQQRLLDLGAVEEARRGSPARAAGGRGGRSRRRASRRRRAPASTGQVLTLSQPGALERRDEAAAAARAARRASRSASAAAPRARRARPANGVRVLDAQASRARGPGSPRPRRAIRAPRAPSNSNACSRARRGRRAARPPGGARRVACRKRTSASTLGASPPRSRHSSRRWSKVARAGGVGRRVDDAERRRRRVLCRAGRVRVERVALESRESTSSSTHRVGRSARRRPAARRRGVERRRAALAVRRLQPPRACPPAAGPSRSPG